MELLGIVGDKIEKYVSPIVILFYVLNLNIPPNPTLAIKAAVYLIVALSIIVNLKKYLNAALCNLPLTIFILFSVSSFFWTSDREFTASVIRNSLVLYFAALYMAVSFSLIQQMRYLAISLGALSILSFIFPQGLYVPGRGWRGLFRHKNRLGNAMVTAILVYTNLLNSKKGLTGLKFIIFIFIFASLILLVLSEGRAALASLFICLSLFAIYSVILQRDYTTKLYLSLGVIYGSIGLCIGLYIGLEYIVVDVLGKDLTFTGRTDMWDYLISRGMTRPWLGFGYGGFWSNPTEQIGVFRDQPWFTGALEGQGNAHNGYIEVFLQFGLIGIFLLAICCINLFNQIILLLLKTRRIEYFWAFQYLVFVLLSNFSETIEAWFDLRSLGWFLFISISTSTSLALKQMRLNSIGESGNPYLTKTYSQRDFLSNIYS